MIGFVYISVALVILIIGATIGIILEEKRYKKMQADNLKDYQEWLRISCQTVTTKLKGN